MAVSRRDMQAEMPWRETERFRLLAPEEKRRQKRTVVAKKNKGLATYEAKSLVQQVIDEVVNSDKSDEVLSEPSPRAAVKERPVHYCSTTDVPEDVPSQAASLWSDETDPEELPKELLGGWSTVSTRDGRDDGGLSGGPSWATSAECGSTWGSTAGLGAAIHKVPVLSSTPTPGPEEYRDEASRRSFYVALRRADAAAALVKVRAVAARECEQSLLAQIDAALRCLRWATQCRQELWQCFYQAPPAKAGYNADASAAGDRTATVLRSAQQCLRSYPQVLSQAWDPATSGDVLGRVALSTPVRLLQSLVEMVEGKSRGLPDVTECMRTALHV